ncbi:3-methyl-2-oxobutanoate hydroxymethyltransferase [Alteromonas oceanisediminis]|uniref:3-methyl-2-oxobutanoate hydroxymethyltransferase n=1 Tax=Alteromonas oceanisediminis TaxID=2836180 RepID=UPI001BDAB718|nr:3-methyl-2-oxobutanoate hydroxymethyltransferase [Alteromonas oceanisediminis]MBT0587681.1 3-methyl-2-oxobutanoate hydroxymethyltransferase [Alteromonas oceanisediminis]
MKAKSIADIQAKKANDEKISALTAYDASFAQLFDQEGIDIILIGDSLGMVLQGQPDTLGVSIDDISYHTRSVRRGVTQAMVVADMPFMSYATPEQTYQNAAKLMANGASMVKLEGGDWLTETIAGLKVRGVPVCGHLGLTPQSVHVLGGFKVQGRQAAQADELVESAIALEQAGAQMLVLECVPVALGKRVADALTIPVIGIGAGVHCDGQILVMHDMLGVSANYMPKFSKNYLADCGDVRQAVRNFIDEVTHQTFPGEQHSFN